MRTPDGHRTAELRSIAFHRVVARDLDADAVERANERVAAWLAEGGPMHPTWAERWQALLALPLGQLRARLVADDEQMRALRQTTPFAGAVTAVERWRIVREVR